MGYRSACALLGLSTLNEVHLGPGTLPIKVRKQQGDSNTDLEYKLAFACFKKPETAKHRQSLG